jgi:hypothetical protein
MPEVVAVTTAGQTLYTLLPQVGDSTESQPGS